MAILTPTIRGLNPQNTVVLNFPGGGLRGISDEYELLIDVQSPPGATLPIQGVAVISVIDSAMYRFIEFRPEPELKIDESFNFTQTNARQSLALRFQIVSVHMLSNPPFPLVISVCTYDVHDGFNFRRCRNGRFPVQRGSGAMRMRTFQ